MSFWDRIKFFKPSEFDSPDKPGSGAGMDENFVNMLAQVRQSVGFSLKINSGYRTEAANAKAGGVKGSAHTIYRAADISAVTDDQKRKIIDAAVKVGFKRIGIGKNFIHLDNSKTHPSPRVWGYNETAERHKAWFPGILAAMGSAAPVSFAEPGKNGIVFGLFGFVAVAAAIFWHLKK